MACLGDEDAIAHGVGSHKEKIYAWPTQPWAIQTSSGWINSLSPAANAIAQRI
jgi:hypothetical protein